MMLNVFLHCHLTISSSNFFFCVCMWCFGSLGTALLHLGSGRVCVSRGCCFCRGCLAKRRVLGSAGLGGGVGLEVYSVQ